MFRRILRSKTLQARARWILAIVMVPPFAFFFHLWTGGRASPGPGGSAGVIFGHHVPWEAFQEEHAFIRRNAEAQWGTLPEALDASFRQQAWDRLILKAEARRRVQVGDEEVARSIQSQPTFQQEGRFVPDLYFRFVRGLGVTAQAFEERVRDDLRIEKLLDSVKAKASLSDEDIKPAYAKERERLQTTMLLIEPSAFEQPVAQALTQTALREYYAAHQDAVRLAPKRLIEYLGMSLSEVLREDIPMTDEAIQAYYDEHTEEFQQEDGSPKPLEEVRGTIQQVIIGKEAGKRLTNLALDLEEDVENGLRFVEIALTRGLLARRVGPIERTAPAIPDGPTSGILAAAFDVPVGRMTHVFNSPIGVFLLIPVEEIPARVPPFEEVSDTVKRLAIQERSHEAAKARASELREQLLDKRKAGFTMDEAYLLLGLEPLRPAPFTRQDPLERLGNVPSVTEALLTLKPGDLSEVLETPQGFLIAFVEERIPFDEAQFAKDKETFRQALLNIKQQEHAAQWLASLRTRARLKSFLEETRSARQQ